VLLAEIQFGPFSIEDPKAFLAQVIGFILLVLLLWFVNVPVFSRPFIRELLVSRETRVEEVHNQLDIAVADTQKLHDDYVERLRNIEIESRLQIDKAVREADAAHDAIIADAKQAAEAVLRRSEEELGREQTRQRILLRRTIVKISLDAAEETVVRLNDDKVQRSLIADFIRHAGSSAGREA
jgi:F0F1-type ATP synthase membrane subunit b/b'